jgi:hypothetical protein
MNILMRFRQQPWQFSHLPYGTLEFGPKLIILIPHTRCLAPESLVSDLERTGRFLDGAVQRATIWTFQTFPAESVDGFRKGLTLHVFEFGSPEGTKVLPPVFF